jgi:Acetyl xylan esterase (AXE1)
MTSACLIPMRKTILAFLLAGALRADDAAIEARLVQPLIDTKQTVVEAQIYLGSRVKPMPPVRDRAEWERYAADLRRRVLDNVVFRGEAAKWRALPVKEEWLETIPADGYRLRKFRYQVLPGLWLPALLYEPLELKGRMPVAVNLNGHEGEGMAIPYIQKRCIHLARNGVLAFNYEWYQKGQMNAPGYMHSRMNQLDLAGTSGLAPFFLAYQRLLDVALKHPNADPARVAVTGLSGGGWQTIMLSSLDPRVKLAVPVAGYSSFLTRTQFPAPDLGDSEQTPVDLGEYADYTHLTALLAPNPTLLANNAFDNCCFRADYAIGPLLVAAQPIYKLFGQPGRLRYHPNFDPGHNYGLDNRQAFYRFLGEFFFPAGNFPDEEKPAELRTPEAVRMPLPEPNADFHSLALRLSETLPRASDIPTDAAALRRWQTEYRKKLREIVRWPDYQVTRQEAVEPSAWRLSVSGWTVPALEFAPDQPAGTTLVLGDEGKAKLASEIGALMERKQRVIAIDPFYFGECRIESRDYLYALLASALGERPLGIQAAQVTAVARWLHSKYGKVTVEAFGPRTSLIAQVSAALETSAIGAVKLHQPMSSLKDPIRKDLEVRAGPELFCFGLAEWFDVKQLDALASPN